MPNFPGFAGAGLLVLLLVIVVGSIVFPPAQWIPAEQWGIALESKGVTGMVIFVAAGMLATSAGLPRQLVAFIAGIAYGVATGVVLSLVAALLGCYLTVNVSKRFFAKGVLRRYPSFIAKVDALVQNDVFVKILALRLQPLGTNLLTNVCVGFTSISIKAFMGATAVGYVPQMLVFALLGSGIRVGSNVQLILSLVLLIISILLGFLIYRRHTQRHKALT
ncbi:MAG: TVP38/TMEM64 family protein [Granulosicoccus sp.]